MIFCSISQEKRVYIHNFDDFYPRIITPINENNQHNNNNNNNYSNNYCRNNSDKNNGEICAENGPLNTRLDDETPNNLKFVKNNNNNDNYDNLTRNLRRLQSIISRRLYVDRIYPTVLFCALILPMKCLFVWHLGDTALRCQKHSRHQKRIKYQFKGLETWRSTQILSLSWCYYNCRFPAFELPLFCIMCIICNITGMTGFCVACLPEFENFKNAREQEILKELLMKLDLREVPNVTVDYDNLPPIGRDNPRVRALIKATLRETGHKRVRKSTRSAFTTAYTPDEDVSGGDGGGGGVGGGGGSGGVGGGVAGGVVPDDYDTSPDDLNYYPELYEPEEKAPPSDISYIVATRPPPWFNQDHKVAYFNVSAEISNSIVLKATMTVFVRRPPIQLPIPTKGIPMHISIYERYVNGTLGDKLAERTVSSHWSDDMDEIRHFQVYLDEEDVREWIKPMSERQNVPSEVAAVTEPDDAFVGLYMQAIYDNVNYIVYPSDSEKNSMFLELEVLPTRANRRRRSFRQAVCKPESNETMCCLYNMMIDFEKVGWNFIIAPKRYNAYICKGDCTAMPLDPTNKHGLVTQKHKEGYRCCHPKEYGSITVVYVTENELIWVRDVPGMVAKRCECS